MHKYLLAGVSAMALVLGAVSSASAVDLMFPKGQGDFNWDSLQKFADAHKDLKGQTGVSTVGSTNLKQISELNTQRRLGLTILAAKDNGEAFRMLETDRADAFVMDDILLYSRMANSATPGTYIVSEEALSVEPYGIMLRRDDPAFKKVVDDALAAVYRSGEIQNIYAKWFLAPIPPNNVSLDIPMAASLKLAVERLIDSGDPAAYMVASSTRSSQLVGQTNH